MKTYTDIKQYEDATGKTVESIQHCGSEPQVVIYFTDGTCFVLQAERGDYDEGPGIHQAGIKIVSDWDLVRHGVMTHEEAEERRVQQAKAHLEQERVNRHRLYRQLRNEFKDVPDPVPTPCGCGICTTHGPGACKAVSWSKATAPLSNQ